MLAVALAGAFSRIVEEVDLAVGPAEEQEAASADVAGLGKNHGECEADRDRRIHGVAALLHDRDAHLGCFGLQRGHHRLGRVHRMHPIAGPSLGANSQNKQQPQQLGSQFHLIKAGECESKPLKCVQRKQSWSHRRETLRLVRGA